MKKKTIGRKELISLPDLNLYDLKCKVDTGAYTSSLHCKDIVITQDGYAHFTPLDEAFNRMKLPLYKQKNVKSSNGTSEFRCYVKTKSNFFGKTYPIVLSLTDRSAMKYPILIGRKFLKDRFIVDVAHEYIGKRKR